MQRGAFLCGAGEAVSCQGELGNGSNHDSPLPDADVTVAA